jgi:ectoine hydroxylase-related dioxygenase (phytanoyl-CoA dioxygenase family)
MSAPQLTPDQVAVFRENGFLSIERITTDDEVAWLQGVYDRLFSERAGETQGEYFDLGGPRAHAGREVLPQVLGPEKKVPELRETLYFRNARRLAALLLGLPEEQVNGGGHMILKPAHYGRETPWHQDEAYWNPEVIPNSLSVWLPLDPATRESGCMQFIPGSHRDEVHRHRHIDDDPSVHGLVTDEADPSRAVACPIPAGGATFHHCRTLHYAGPNTTDRPRRAYILVLSGPPTKRERPDARPWQEEERQALARLDSLAAPRE